MLKFEIMAGKATSILGKLIIAFRNHEMYNDIEPG
jgi:hypothetical protein